MKILLISDEESPYLWDHYQPGRLDDIDLILSCGDLKPAYLSFLVTLSYHPVLFCCMDLINVYTQRDMRAYESLYISHFYFSFLTVEN